MVIGENNNQPPQTMHFCKVCNKGFSRGGALGGHMRSHGIEDINAKNNEEGNKLTYFLRTPNNQFTNYGACNERSSNNLLLWEPVEHTGSFKSIKEKYDTSGTSKEEKEMANCLVMLSNGEEEEKAKEVVKGNFQCKACKKVFNSHQALGGHRASHKRVKGCFAARFENIDDDNIVEDDNELSNPTNSDALHLIDLNSTSEAPAIFSPLKKKFKVHECSICHRVFSSGQALGGHKRCHWLISNMAENNAVPTFRGFRYDSEQLFKKPMICKSQLLDLNLPTLFDDTYDDSSSKFEALTRIYLPPRSEEEIKEVNLPKLSEMREMNLDGNCSTWLQVGIGQTTE
ncbi:zinc finger protein ZAT9-like [Rhododendron vialii]|uniref:zinc finger protein ZAT9-like n=1 Tax=Rhododendron vialii TaxID=182163 RepID=UPI00265FF091|nr:zinc finger protein ZAT9-like [Rhododendron vialii]